MFFNQENNLLHSSPTLLLLALLNPTLTLDHHFFRWIACTVSDQMSSRTGQLVLWTSPPTLREPPTRSSGRRKKCALCLMCAHAQHRRSADPTQTTFRRHPQHRLVVRAPAVTSPLATPHPCLSRSWLQRLATTRPFVCLFVFFFLLRAICVWLRTSRSKKSVQLAC